MVEAGEVGRQLQRRRAALADVWNLSDEVVLLAAGEPIHRPGRDDGTYRFEAHSDYYYLTDRNRPGGVRAFDPREGWVEFVAPVTTSERLWSGAPDVEPVEPTTDELEAWLASRRGRPIAWLGAPPSDRRFCAGDLVLIDASAEYLGYASDITRTYPVGGQLSSEQRELHAIVEAAQRAALEHCRAVVEWRDVHRRAGLVIAEGLVSFGVLRGDEESLVESGAVWLFLAHGIGHLVGLGVRDAGGIPLRERRDDPRPYPNLRIDLPLEPGMVVTVEPGIYFVPALLNDPDKRRQHHDEVDWARVDAMLGFGGIRIEDNALITPDKPEVITADVPVLG